MSFKRIQCLNEYSLIFVQPPHPPTEKSKHSLLALKKGESPRRLFLVVLRWNTPNACESVRMDADFSGSLVRR